MKSADSRKASKAASPAQPITTPVLVLVEGDDEYYLVQWMSGHWFGEKAALIGFENVGGKDKFPSHLRALQTRSHGPLEVVGVIADSEDDARATQQRWGDLFGEVQPKIKPPCSLLQLPSESAPGAFETLVLQALKDDSIAACALTFRDCVSAQLNDRTAAQRDKIAVQSWLGARFGRAYGNVFKAQKAHPDAKVLDYDNAVFLPIKHFLEELLAQVAVKPRA